MAMGNEEGLAYRTHITRANPPQPPHLKII